MTKGASHTFYSDCIGAEFPFCSSELPHKTVSYDCIGAEFSFCSSELPPPLIFSFSFEGIFKSSSQACNTMTLRSIQPGVYRLQDNRWAAADAGEVQKYRDYCTNAKSVQDVYRERSIDSKYNRYFAFGLNDRDMHSANVEPTVTVRRNGVYTEDCVLEKLAVRPSTCLPCQQHHNVVQKATRVIEKLESASATETRKRQRLSDKNTELEQELAFMDKLSPGSATEARKRQCLSDQNTELERQVHALKRKLCDAEHALDMARLKVPYCTI